MSDSERIRWPEEHLPEHAPVHTVNQLDIDVPIDTAWAWLIRAQRWPAWYAHARDVRFESHAGPDLAMGTRFNWITLGLRVRTTVREFEAPTRLAWDGGALGAKGYHAWLLEPTDSGCRVLTEEVQSGLGPSVGRWVLRRRLWFQHERWLEGLALMAKTGPPS